jgi:hypothetical protein
MLYQPEKFVFEEFRKLNRESVLTIDADIDRRVLESGESRPLKISFSHFGGQPLKNGTVRWMAVAGKKVLKQGAIQGINAESGGITELGSIPLGPFDSVESLAVRVQVELASNVCRQSNDWKFWVFPKKKKDMPSAGICNLTGEASLDARYGCSGASALAEAKVALVRELTPDILKYLEAGGRVIFLVQDPAAAATRLPSVANSIPSLSQSCGFLKTPGAVTYWASWLRCNAQIVENHPAMAAFPHEGFPDFQLMRLYGQATRSVDLTLANSIARSKVKPIIWALDLAPWTQEPSPFGLVMTWHGLLSECRVEKGKALLCTLYVADGVKAGLPEAGYLLDCLIDYAISDRFEPSVPPLTSAEAQEMFLPKPAKSK